MKPPPTPPTPSSPPSYSPPLVYPQPTKQPSKGSAAVTGTALDAGGSRGGSVLGDVSGSATPTHPGSHVVYMEDAESVSEDDTEPVHPAYAIPFHMRSTSVPLSRTSSNASSLAEEGEGTPLLSSQDEDGGYKGKWYQGPLFVAAVKLGILFAVFTLVVVGTFYFGMPKMDPEDKGAVKLPRSFADIQALNALFQKYKHKYPLRILACGVVSYLFVQTFSLPGSMYISILFGAAYGIMYGLLLSCICESIGSLFCYSLSAILAPPLLTLPFYRARVETWRTKIMGDPKSGKKVTWDSIFAILLVLRIAPFPPHWVANFVAPHLGIGMFLFWSSCFIGIAPVSVIHVTIGSSLDDMTSAADFHILSLRNILGLSAVIVAVLIPVGLKRIFKKDLGDLGEAEEALAANSNNDREITVPHIGLGSTSPNRGGGYMYHAIDSGVVLAVPSRGDGVDMRKKIVRRGKGRALEIIPDDESEGSGEGEGETHEMAASPLALSDALADAQQDPTLYEADEDDDLYGPSPVAGPSSHPSNAPSPSPFAANEYQYRVYDPSNRIESVHYKPRPLSRNSSSYQSSRRAGAVKPHRPNTLQGYGSVEAPRVPMEIREEERATRAGWWPWARTGVA
ncbi:hypothetical protein B9479_000257 [Cryptococcus floricola]|uniref:VTT domain-containing protein n=1 Tax=Cryptococcus floricola TaxID=2591691 RepID=A0A5D3B4Y3_9TREE|nr:hypothetical protein B9479_000257 [Cryptococcus floricola]